MHRNATLCNAHPCLCPAADPDKRPTLRNSRPLSSCVHPLGADALHERDSVGETHYTASPGGSSISSSNQRISSRIGLRTKRNKTFAADSMMSEPSPSSSAAWVTSTTSLIACHRSRASLSLVPSESPGAAWRLLRRVPALDDFELDFPGLAFRGGLMMATYVSVLRDPLPASRSC